MHVGREGGGDGAAATGGDRFLPPAVLAVLNAWLLEHTWVSRRRCRMLRSCVYEHIGLAFFLCAAGRNVSLCRELSDWECSVTVWGVYVWSYM